MVGVERATECGRVCCRLGSEQTRLAMASKYIDEEDNGYHGGMKDVEEEEEELDESDPLYWLQSVSKCILCVPRLH